MDGSDRQSHGVPHLFLLRLWREELTQGQGEWRGQMTSLASGEVRYFRSPETLYRILLIMLSNDSASNSALDRRGGEEGEFSDAAER